MAFVEVRYPCGHCIVVKTGLLEMFLINKIDIGDHDGLCPIHGEKCKSSFLK